MGLAETKEAIDAAAKAFPAWSRTTAKYRHDILLKFHALMQEHNDDLARIITLENGKTLAEAKVFRLKNAEDTHHDCNFREKMHIARRSSSGSVSVLLEFLGLSEADNLIAEEAVRTYGGL
ncbi:hypothetical protein H0H81_005909 [Sphagnurus paluster]|uniref:Aldehyde dehydrogenase domain-containing protein n=1 Tax=Sphagnurus paluster TaxID=117069 RepID=A0A9P7GWM6_9AGAR|nr:hypothetical protein H0H81_005909 [Sphagnurus paluster]